MKKVCIIFFLLLPIDLMAARLSCELHESKKMTDSFSRPISIEGDQSTFQFTEPLIGEGFQGQVSWDTKFIQLYIKKKTDSLGVTKADFWQDPIEQSFFLRHGETHIICQIDINDGLSWKWKETRTKIGDAISIINFSLESILTLAQKNVLPAEEAQLHSGICLLIGNLQNTYQVNDLFLSLIKFDRSQLYRDIFPEGYSFYRKLKVRLTGLMNFCAKDLISDPTPIHFQDRVQLANRCNEIMEINLNLLEYLDKQFPNKGSSFGSLF